MRPDDHGHVPAVLLGRGFDKAEVLDVTGEALQQPEPEFGPGLLTPAEHDRHLDLVSRLEEPLDMALLGAIVVRVDLRPELDLLDDVEAPPAIGHRAVAIGVTNRSDGNRPG